MARTRRNSTFSSSLFSFRLNADCASQQSAAFGASLEQVSKGTTMRKLKLQMNGPQMKKTRIIYWVITGLMAAFMLMASIPDVLRIPEAVAMFTHLGYPTYLLPFIGVAKILGVLTIIVPGFSRLKEWASAGLVFDLVGGIVFTHCRQRSRECVDIRRHRIAPGIGLVFSPYKKCAAPIRRNCNLAGVLCSSCHITDRRPFSTSGNLDHQLL
jgi:uncharacterized membrane protein YphA (DoxX/SURF4 family)